MPKNDSVRLLRMRDARERAGLIITCKGTGTVAVEEAYNRREPGGFGAIQPVLSAATPPAGARKAEPSPLPRGTSGDYPRALQPPRAPW